MSALPADAAGLGRLSVQSALGQPLRAEVEVTSLTRDEAQSLSARLAPPDAFRQAGLEFNPALSGLRFAIEPRNGRTFVRITSTQPINEPFVDLLLELNWATGKFVREYTFLLDPPELRTARESIDGAAPGAASAVSSPAPVSSVPAPAPVATAPLPLERAPAPAVQAPVPTAQTSGSTATPAADPRAERAAAALTAARAERARPAGGATSIQVRRGDTLGSITRGLRLEGATLDQAMIAIYRGNPSAFINNNINLVREGATLNIPGPGAMAAIDVADATREVRDHGRDFNAYRQRLAGAPRTVDTPRSGQTATGAIGGSVTGRSGPSQGGDQLLLSKPGAAGAGAGAGAGSAGAAGEQAVARDAALREARSRITDLEKNVSDLQKLLELKNKALADTQKQLDDARSAGKSVTGAVGGGPPVARIDPPKAPAAPGAPAAEPPRTVAVAPPSPPAAPPKLEAPRVQPAAPVTAPPTAPVSPPSGFFGELLGNPFLLPGLGGLALLGAGYGWYAIRRRRKVEKFEDSLIAADAFASNSLFGSTGGQSVDTSNSVFTGGATASGDVHSTEVDPIAEADVYIAYGREAQAEEILKEALKRQPERQAIRAKLLEIYAGRKDAKAFEALAREMYDQTGGANDEWPKVVSLGLAIDPTNPLYGGSPSSASSGAALPGAAAVAAAGVSAAVSAGRDSRDAQVQEPAATAASESDDIPSLDFDLNLDTRIDRAAAAEGVETGDTVSGRLPSDSTAGDLAGSLDQGFELPSLDLDERPSALAAGPLDLDLPALERLSQGGAGDGEPALDLSPISLDLEPATVSADGEEVAAGGAGRWQEMATKLDLASAYEEIGDKEGARELLQEVIKGGDNGQQQKARAMLGKIG